MIDSRIQLTILEDNASTFTDHSVNMADYMRDSATLAMVAGTDYLYIGFRKPINSVYAEVTTVDASNSELTIQAYNGTSWASIDSRDETNGMARSGFISWNRADLNEVEVDSTTLYWIRLSYDNGNTATLAGLNLVFSDDQMLKTEFPSINDPRIIPSGQVSNIVHHVSARNLIVQTLRNEGNIKIDSNNQYENITQWDLLDIYEIREAATYLALSKIFFVLSDDVEDNWWSKHKEYMIMYNKTFATARLSLDTDDDGIKDDTENLVTRKSIRFTR